MTTFEDPPPHSRRSARLSERVDGQEAQPPGQFTAPDAQEVVPPTLPPQAAEPPTTGRRARTSAPEGYEPSPFAEPLEYMTQSGYREAELQQAPPQAPPPVDAPYRVRDFSPEGGRRAAPPIVEPGAMPHPVVQVPGAPSELTYQTQGAPVGYQPPSAVPPTSRRAAQPQPLEAAEPVEHLTMSRREVRQRQAEAEATLLAQQAPPPPAAASLRTAPPPPASAASLRTAPPPPASAASLRTAPPPPAAPSVSAPPPSVLTSAIAEFEALTRPAPPSGVEQTVGGYVPPVGHWSRQADLDDEGQPWENTITREVGGGNVATTSSALVIPEIPRGDHFSSALDSTGDVLLTGSIDLPRDLGSSGGDSRRYDSPNVDYMFDTQDREFPATDSAPVRAIKAVSTATSARGVIHTNKPSGNRMLTVLLVTASAMAVGVVALLVAGMAFNIF